MAAVQVSLTLYFLFYFLRDRVRVLKAIRSLKSTMGLAFLHPDVLVKIAELNITTKNRYLEIYIKEEASLQEETTRVKSLKLKLDADLTAILRHPSTKVLSMKHT